MITQPRSARPTLAHTEDQSVSVKIIIIIIITIITNPTHNTTAKMQRREYFENGVHIQIAAAAIRRRVVERNRLTGTGTFAYHIQDGTLQVTSADGRVEVTVNSSPTDRSAVATARIFTDTMMVFGFGEQVIRTVYGEEQQPQQQPQQRRVLAVTRADRGNDKFVFAAASLNQVQRGFSRRNRFNYVAPEIRALFDEPEDVEEEEEEEEAEEEEEEEAAAGDHNEAADADGGKQQ